MALLAGNEFAGKRDALIQRPIGVDNQLRLRDRLKRGFEALIKIERAVCGRVMARGLVAFEALAGGFFRARALDGAEGRSDFLRALDDGFDLIAARKCAAVEEDDLSLIHISEPT